MVLRTTIAFVLVATMSACAYDTYGRHPGPNNGRSSRVSYPFDDGYRDGYEHGRHDARDGNRYKPQPNEHYRKADNGRGGSRGGQKQEYRRGFLAGYEEGYRDGRGRDRRRGRP